MEETKKFNGYHAVTLFSGGQDSTTCLYWAKKHFNKVSAIGFFYGQNHSVELEQAQKICDREGITLKIVDIAEIMKLSKSALTEKGGDVNVVREDGLPASYVPNRNQIFLTLAHSYAQLIEADSLVTGVCQTDFSGYPDCRQVFINKLEEALEYGSNKNIGIWTPLMFINKAETFKLAKDLGVLDVIINDTMTCYNGDTTPHYWGMGCSECPSCKLRQKGFDEFLELTETDRL